MIAGFVLPWFGGGSGVWSCCLLFFQGILLIGYLYAHGLARLMPLRRQVVVHGLLLLASMLRLPITPDATLEPASVVNPNGELLWPLFRVGLE